jgi:hypothetical protein
VNRLRILEEERTALQARWPEVVLALSEDDRKTKVREGSDTVVLHDGDVTRGFVRAVLTVPLGHPKGAVYGVFVEVDRAAYAQLQRAYREHEPAEVWGTLATKLPYLDDAFGAAVLVREEGGEMRARVVEAKSASIKDGPKVGRR